MSTEGILIETTTITVADAQRMYGGLLTILEREGKLHGLLFSQSMAAMQFAVGVLMKAGGYHMDVDMPVRHAIAMIANGYDAQTYVVEEPQSGQIQ